MPTGRSRRRGGSGRGPPARGVRAPQYLSDGLSVRANFYDHRDVLVVERGVEVDAGDGDSKSGRQLGELQCGHRAGRYHRARGSSTMHGMAAERLISADSYVAISQAQVERHLAPKFHDEYDAAIVEAQFQGGPDDERELIVSGNATRVWNL
jgi:hypothetical protein